MDLQVEDATHRIVCYNKDIQQIMLGAAETNLSIRIQSFFKRHFFDRTKNHIELFSNLYVKIIDDLEARFSYDQAKQPKQSTLEQIIKSQEVKSIVSFKTYNAVEYLLIMPNKLFMVT